MEIALEKTNSSRIARALVKARVCRRQPGDGHGADPARRHRRRERQRRPAAPPRRCRASTRRASSASSSATAAAAAELNAKVRVGENSSGESILLRISGELTKHAESVVLPLLLPDSPVVVWWPGNAPSDPSADAIGSSAPPAHRRRGHVSPVRALKPRRPALHAGRHRPVVDPPHAVAGAARRGARPVDRQGHRRRRRGRHRATRPACSWWPGSRAGSRCRSRSASDASRSARSCSTPRRATSSSNASTRSRATSAFPARRRARCRWARGRSPSCSPRTCADSTPTRSTTRPSSTC